MKKNVGAVDKTIRIVIGLIIIVLGIIYKSWWGALGLVLLVTAFSGFCALYIPLKLSTRKKD
jgi:hypothetical protein